MKFPEHSTLGRIDAQAWRIEHQGGDLGHHETELLILLMDAKEDILMLLKLIETYRSAPAHPRRSPAQYGKGE